MTADRGIILIVGAARDGDHSLAAAAKRRGLTTVLIENAPYVDAHRPEIHRAPYDQVISMQDSPGNAAALCEAVRRYVPISEVRTVVPGTELYVEATWETMRNSGIGPPGGSLISDPSKVGARLAIGSHGAGDLLPHWRQVAESIPDVPTLDAENRRGGGKERNHRSEPRHVREWAVETARNIAAFAWSDAGNIDVSQPFPDPVIVKGDRGGDGRGILLVPTFFDAALAARVLAHMVPFDGAAIDGVFVDRFVAGQHVSLQGVVDRKGALHPITFTHKHRRLLPAEGVVPLDLLGGRPRPVGLAGFRDDVYITRHGADIPPQMHDAGQRLVKALNYRCGAVQIDFILERGPVRGTRYEEHLLKPSFEGSAYAPDLGFRYSGHRLLAAGNWLLRDGRDGQDGTQPATEMWLSALLGEDVSRPSARSGQPRCTAMFDVSSELERYIVTTILRNAGLPATVNVHAKTKSSDGAHPFLAPDVEHARGVEAGISFTGSVADVYDAVNGALAALNEHRSQRRGLPREPNTASRPASSVNGAMNGHRINSPALDQSLVTLDRRQATPEFPAHGLREII